MQLLKEIQNLDPKNIGNWPLPFKAITIGLLCVVVFAGGIYFDTTKQIQALEKSKGMEVELKKDFEEKYAKAGNLEFYKHQMDVMQKTFANMLRQLPSKTEVEALLDDISRLGITSGLRFELFKPETVVPVEFYAELPIKLRVTGNYHEFGNFVSGVAALPRIVTLHDFKIFKAKSDTNDNLIMEATAKTYRYLDDDEADKVQRGKK